ncbi:MAG: hypothetical protein AMXMBFR44_3130 [Candidatus Campbellbacteria bacterium]
MPGRTTTREETMRKIAPHSGHEHWIGNFKVRISGLLKQIGQLPAGERRNKVEKHLRAASELIEDLRHDPMSDADRNLALLSALSGTDISYDEHAVPV